MGVEQGQNSVSASEGWVTAKIIARYLGVSTANIYRSARKRTIPSLRIGRTVRFSIAEVVAALQVDSSKG